MDKILLNIKFDGRNLLVFLISIFPISLLIGSGVINSFIIVIDLLFLVLIIKEKNYKFFKNKTFYILLILWGSLILNMLLSLDQGNSFSRSVGFIRFLIFVFAIKFVLNKNEKHDNIIFLSWVLLFILVSFDVVFEYIFGFNTLGFNNNFSGRISSFLNDELKIGNFYLGFFLISLSFIYYTLKNKYYFFFSLIIFTVVSFLIGERSNFLRIIPLIILFFFIIDRKFIFKKISTIIVIFSLVFLIITQNNNYKDRFINQTFSFLAKNNYSVTHYFKFSIYGAHYNAAYQVFKDYPLFGVGLKNFRIESGRPKYENDDFRFTARRQNTHPHQIHLEFLSELGLIGYLFFLIFFYIFLKRSISIQIKNRNLYHLSGLLFLFVFFIPLIPTGSFFTTYGAAIFWLNFAIIEAFND